MAEQHIVLCGDSIFDNRSYVKHGEPDVARQVQQKNILFRILIKKL